MAERFIQSVVSLGVTVVVGGVLLAGVVLLFMYLWE